MKDFFSRLYRHYYEYHAYGPPRLKYMGYLGIVSLALFYFIRFTKPNPQLYDDAIPRGFALVLLALLALKDRWPERLKPHYIGYSYFVLIYCLPCFTVLVGLQRGGGTPSISNLFIVLCFLVLLADWRNTIVMLLAGVGLAALIYVATSPDPRIPMDLVAQIPAYALIVIGSNLFKFSTEQIDAERKLRATQALAGSIAHEMRHPLARVKHSLQRIHEALAPPASAGGAQPPEAPGLGALYGHVAEGELAVKRGLQVIAMTLDEVNAKPLDPAAFTFISAAEVTRKAVQEYGYDSDAERDSVDVQVIEDFSFRGDETACLFVLFNLVKNALYYLPRHPQMRITITVERPQVRVRDTGPGIPAEARSQLFEPFKSSGKPGGTGLGLAYCDRVMRAFGGEIACASAPGEYTEFTLRLPLADAQEAQVQQRAMLDAASTAFAGMRILLADDDAVQRTATRHKLQQLPTRFDEAADGQQALDLALQHRYDLVLLDLNMPLLDGYEVARRLRAGHGATPRTVPIVAHTAEPAHLAGAKVRRAGMDGFVAKPSTQNTLLRALHQAIERPRAASAAADALHGRSVLLVDDAAWNRKAVAGYLRQAGVRVTHAAHGEEALRTLAGAAAWDAVVMDINMPGMDGLEATRAIREGGGRFAGVPVIGLTAHSDAALLARARAAGMNEVLTKPVDADLLFHLLRHWIAAAGTRPPQPVQAQPAASARPLLDAERLETYREIGMFGELVDDCVPAMLRIAEQLQASAARRDLEASLQALHSLLGMSGEAGATALYQLVRRVYVPMVEERRWPDATDWPEQIGRLTRETGEALKAYAA